MGYTSGMHWHVTQLDSTTITWVSFGPSRTDRARVHAILDPSSSEPARRISRDGATTSLSDSENAGLTVFGLHSGDRPAPERVAEIAPEYGELMQRFRRGRGVTYHRFTGTDDPLLSVREAAARIGVQPRTISRYRARGELPAPDEVVSGRPRWRGSTLDQWHENRPGRGRAAAAPASRR